MLRALQRLIGSDRVVRVEGVTYRRLRAARAADRKGQARYRVRFADGAEMIIHPTPQRSFADLAGVESLEACRLAEPVLRPGMRVLVYGGGTGSVAAWCARCVGPSGAVVSLESDAESVRFARRRYPLPNVAFERGGVETLSGELGDAFDGALIGQARAIAASTNELAEVIRATAPGGWVFAAAPASTPDPKADSRDAPGEATLRERLRAAAEARGSELGTQAPEVEIAPVQAPGGLEALLVRLPPPVEGPWATPGAEP